MFCTNNRFIKNYPTALSSQILPNINSVKKILRYETFAYFSIFLCYNNNNEIDIYGGINEPISKQRRN